METNEKVNELLNELVQINNDRIDGYEKALKETEDGDLKNLFMAFATKSRLLKSELGTEIVNRGGTPSESTTTSGKAFRVWMDFKAAMTGKDRKAILNSCEFGEDAALSTYDKVLDSSNELPANLVTLVRQQKEKLSDDHDSVKKLRDSVIHAL